MVPLNNNVNTNGITVENLTASWSMSLDDTTLQDISFNIDQVLNVRIYVYISSYNFTKCIMNCL